MPASCSSRPVHQHHIFPPVTHLVSAEALNEGVRLLHAAVHHHGDADGQAAQDLLVLGLLGVAHHVLDGLGRLGAQHDQAQREACSLTWWRDKGLHGAQRMGGPKPGRRSLLGSVRH